MKEEESQGLSYLEIGPPLSLAVKQRIQNPAAGFSVGGVVAAHHVVRSTHSLEELLVHILGTAVIGDVGQVYVDGGSWWYN